MKIFAIRDEHDPMKNDRAYIFCFEKEKRFYIELPDDADPWDTPLILSSLLERGYKTINAYWSKVWVQQRIIPPDRQNLGQILKDNGLNTYDEYKLLIMSKGRCSQDNYYLTETAFNSLPESIKKRYEHKVEDVIPLAEKALLVFFRNGEVKRCKVKRLLEAQKGFAPLLKNDDYFKEVEVEIGGYGVTWGEQLVISDEELYNHGESIPLCYEDFVNFVRKRVITTTEAADILQCSKQNIDDLARRGKLEPVKEAPKSKFFLKSEVMQRLH